MNPNMQSGSNDEIDINQLFKSIGVFFFNIWIAFVKMLAGIRSVSLRFKYLLLGMLVAGGISGGLASTQGQKYYRSSMLLQSEFFKGQLIENSIEKLNRLTNKEDRPALAQLLGIDISTAEKISRFETSPFVSEEEIVEVELLKQELQSLRIDDTRIQQVIDRVQIENKSTYEITVYVYDPGIIVDLQDPIVEYFASNPFLKKRLQITKRNREAEIQKLERDLSKMDSLKNRYIDYIGSIDATSPSASTLIMAEENAERPVSIFLEDTRLFQRKLNLEEQLELQPEFEVVDGFTAFSSPENPGVIKSAITGSAVGLGIGYVLLILAGINRYLSTFEREQTRN